MRELLIKVDRYEDAEIYRFDLFRRDGYVQFYNTWESDRTFRSKCPLGLPGTKFELAGEICTVRSYTIREIDGSNVWAIQFSTIRSEKMITVQYMSGPTAGEESVAEFLRGHLHILDAEHEVKVMLVEELNDRVKQLEDAIREHRNQRADDRCWLDDLTLYAVLNDDVVTDNRVGDQCAMLRNCERFIKNRCDGGGPWKSYAELETENELLRQAIEGECPPMEIEMIIDNMMEPLPPIHLDRPILPMVNFVFDSRTFPWEMQEEFAGLGIFPEELCYFEPDLSGTPPDLR